jgi:hypothetical protein
MNLRDKGASSSQAGREGGNCLWLYPWRTRNWCVTACNLPVAHLEKWCTTDIRGPGWQGWPHLAVAHHILVRHGYIWYPWRVGLPLPPTPYPVDRLFNFGKNKRK